ncbi:Predicted membrane protein [Serratia entomophila]|nr:Predicted membrane protein [Serratia entomophila]CAI1738578.1 Predicted membrane protein [Serratia entomophila]CAI1759289.1 Predicted membrane protein [Serratia entomophila]CAI1812501.1 Predicted membrane protein [Serratia entomophila]CAI1857342.1 Predicted membrane protein [Serratia entomophila]
MAETPQSKKNALFNGLITWFMQGNPLVKLGILLLFFGLTYLLKYTVERDMLPIELRLMG